MKRLICMIFILVLVAPLFTDDRPLFEALQFSAWMLIDLDTICTYHSIWNYKLGEVNPFWRNKLDTPALVFALDMAIKISMTWGLQKFYKKNKYVAYFVVIFINVVQVGCIYAHLNAWRK